MNLLPSVRSVSLACVLALGVSGALLAQSSTPLICWHGTPHAACSRVYFPPVTPPACVVIGLNAPCSSTAPTDNGLTDTIPFTAGCSWAFGQLDPFGVCRVPEGAPSYLKTVNCRAPMGDGCEASQS